MAWVDRNTYMERLWALEGTRDIKVITGMRCSGKPELMKAFSASVARKDPSSNNVYIDLLDLDNEPLLEYHTLHREIIGSCPHGKSRRRMGGQSCPIDLLLNKLIERARSDRANCKASACSPAHGRAG